MHVPIPLSDLVEPRIRTRETAYEPEELIITIAIMVPIHMGWWLLVISYGSLEKLL